MTSRQYYIAALEKQLWTLWPSSKWESLFRGHALQKALSFFWFSRFFFSPELKTGQDHIHLPHLNLPVFFSLRADHSGLKLKILPCQEVMGVIYQFIPLNFWHKMNHAQALKPFSSYKLQKEKNPFPICVTPCSHYIIILSLCLYLPCLKVTGLTGSQLSFWYTRSLPQYHN